MPEYSYQASGDDGHSVTGELSAESVAAAIAALEASGLTVESISLTSIGQSHRPSAVNALGTSSPSRFDTTTLDRQFDAVMERREILIPALAALASEMPAGRGRREIQQLVGLLQKAQTAPDLRGSKVALQWLPFLTTGFTTESSTRRLSDLIAHASRESENRSQRRRLLAYPLVVMLIALAVFAFLCVMVVPTFGSMYADFGVRVPWSTRLVVGIADQLQHHPIQLVLIVGLTSAAIYGLVRLWVHFALTTRVFGIFVAGNSASVSAMSSLTIQLAELLSIGVELPEALWIAGQGCQHYHFKNVAEKLARFAHAANGPLNESPVARSLPANVIHALQAGPNGGPQIRLLRELSEMYGDRAGERVDWSTSATAQFAIVVLGIMVGFVVIALLSPLISLVTSLF